jgi:hypothetical protein
MRTQMETKDARPILETAREVCVYCGAGTDGSWACRECERLEHEAEEDASDWAADGEPGCDWWGRCPTNRTDNA